jgi:hypothetical protein
MLVQHPNGTDPEATAIIVPEFRPESDVTFRLAGEQVVVTVQLCYTATIADTFPEDLAGARELDHLDAEVGAREWLPREYRGCTALIVASAANGRPLPGHDDVPPRAYLRQQAERYINAYCEMIRRDRAERMVSAR